MELNYKTFGDVGDPVIILHGLLGSLDNWQTLAKRLSEQYRVFTPDQRNHGRSPHHPEMNYDVMAGDLLNFMDRHGISGAHLIGHSMGGKTAMHFATAYPDRVKRMVVVDIGPKSYPPGHDDVFKALGVIDPRALGSRREAEVLMARIIPGEALRLFLLKNLTREADGYRWKMNLPVIEEAYEEIRSGLPENRHSGHHTLFIKGGRSGYIDPGDWPQIQSVFPEATLATIPQAGHWVHADAPEVLLAMVRDFLMAKTQAS